MVQVYSFCSSAIGLLPECLARGTIWDLCQEDKSEGELKLRATIAENSALALYSKA